MSSTDISGPPCRYLPYLPHVFTSAEADRDRFLDRFLRVFEKILTGRPDGPPIVTVRNGVLRRETSVEETIDRLPDLFDPWRTEERFLPVLAAWVGLKLDEDWDEYRRRRMVESITTLYQQRWQKRGLFTYLDLYAATPSRPRVAIDDGEAVLRCRLVQGNFLDVQPVAFAWAGTYTDPDLPNATIRLGLALTHPTAIAVSGTGSDKVYAVVDEGPMDLDLGVTRRPGLWRISETGRFLDWHEVVPGKPSTSGNPGRPPVYAPKPLNAGEKDPPPAGDPFPLRRPLGITIDGANGYFVLDAVTDQPDTAVVYHYAIPGSRTVFADKVTLGACLAVDVIRNNDGQLFVLDAGSTVLAKAPAVIVLTPSATPGAPPTVARFDLDPALVVKPTALALDSVPDTVLIADARKQLLPAVPDPATYLDDGVYPPEVLAILVGDIIRVKLDTPVVQESLMAGVTDNPLVYPSGLVQLTNGDILVADQGLKNGEVPGMGGLSDPNNRVMAEPARVFRITPSAGGTRIAEVRLNRPLVVPMRLVLDGDSILIPEYGFFQSTTNFEWRTRPHRFGIYAAFSGQRPTTTDERNEIYRALAGVVNREKPGHTLWDFQFQGGTNATVSTPTSLAHNETPEDAAS